MKRKSSTANTDKSNGDPSLKKRKIKPEDEKFKRYENVTLPKGYYAIRNSLITNDLDNILSNDINSKSKEFNTIIDGLRKTFHIAHIHGNNYSEINRESNFPSSIEITFISKKLLKGIIKKSDMKYPIKGLDQPNRHSKADINLSFS